MGSFSTSSCLPWHWHWKDLLNLEPTSKASIPSPNFKPKASTFNNPNPQPGLNSNPFSRNGSPLHEQPSRLPKSPKFQSSTPTLAQRNAHITHRRRHQSNPPPEPKISGFPGPNHSGSGDTPCGTPRSTSLQPELPPEPDPAAAGMGTKGGLGLAGRLKCQPPASFLTSLWRIWRRPTPYIRMRLHREGKDRQVVQLGCTKRDLWCVALCLCTTELNLGRSTDKLQQFTHDATPLRPIPARALLG